MTAEQQDAVKAKNKKTRLKCEFCDKLGHTESECGMLKSTIADLKKENAKKSVACTTSTPAEEKGEEEGRFEAVYVHSTETVLYNQYNPLCEDLVLCDHCASASIYKNKKLLTNLRSSGTITFTGIGGSIDFTQQGVGTVAYDERATFNVLSVDSLPTSSIVTYNHDDRCHTISIKDKKYHYKVPPGQKRLPVRRFPHVNPNLSTASHILASTVAQNESMYTRIEVEEAKQAQELY